MKTLFVMTLLVLTTACTAAFARELPSSELNYVLNAKDRTSRELKREYVRSRQAAVTLTWLRTGGKTVSYSVAINLDGIELRKRPALIEVLTQILQEDVSSYLEFIPAENKSQVPQAVRSYFVRHTGRKSGMLREQAFIYFITLDKALRKVLENVEVQDTQTDPKYERTF